MHVHAAMGRMRTREGSPFDAEKRWMEDGTVEKKRMDGRHCREEKDGWAALSRRDGWMGGTVEKGWMEGGTVEKGWMDGRHCREEMDGGRHRRRLGIVQRAQSSDRDMWATRAGTSVGSESRERARKRAQGQCTRSLPSYKS